MSIKCEERFFESTDRKDRVRYLTWVDDAVETKAVALIAHGVCEHIILRLLHQVRHRSLIGFVVLQLGLILLGHVLQLGLQLAIVLLQVFLGLGLIGHGVEDFGRVDMGNLHLGLCHSAHHEEGDTQKQYAEYFLHFIDF